MAEDEKRDSSVRLTSERVLDAALERVRKDGIDFSMRALADDLNVWPMAIYRHFKNRDALIEAIVDAVLGLVVSGEAVAALQDETVDWQARLERFNLHSYDTFIQYPGVSRKVIHGAQFTPNGLYMIETVAKFFMSVGLDRIRAAGTFQTIGFFVAEMADIEYARMTGDSDLQGLLDQITSQKDTYPIAVEFIHLMAVVEPRDRLRAGLGLFTRAIEVEVIDN
ncbi:MAG: TetR/AcrR family transcriptional regulator [Pseudomonadota bacterium]